MNILVDIVPTKYRKYAIYAPFALIGLVLGVLGLTTDLTWVVDATLAYTFVGTALGLTAYANTNPPPPTDDLGE